MFFSVHGNTVEYLGLDFHSGRSFRMWNMTKSTIFSLRWIFDGTRAHRYAGIDVHCFGIDVRMSKDRKLFAILSQCIGSLSDMLAYNKYCKYCEGAKVCIL